MSLVVLASRLLVLSVAVLGATAAPAHAQAPDAGPPDAAASVDGSSDAGSDAGPDAATDAGPDAGEAADAGEAVDAAVPAPPPALPADTLPQEFRPALSLTVEPPSGVMTGDLVTLVITADANAGDDVAIPRQEFAPFEVLDSAAEPPRAGEAADGAQSARFSFRIDLLALAPGDHEIGPVLIRVVTAGGTLGDVYTAPVTIEVGSVLGNEPDAQPKPPTAPVEVVEEDYSLAWIGGGLLGLALLALIMFLVTRWWLRREKPLPPPPPPRPAWEVALEELGALGRRLDEDAETQQLTGWVDELSDSLRVYLGARYGFDGIESTTDEAVARVRRKKPRGITAEQVAGILGDCDLVKFAKATPEQERCIALLDAATGIVRATTARLGGEVVTDVPWGTDDSGETEETANAGETAEPPQAREPEEPEEPEEVEP
ncbi:MAG: hypothetical protein JRH11_27835 [Deltaproteobacteria bacterium]|nr:hypothetical protein [Deltaproteobacteria bacterium]